ncbi:B2 bradykinin receptor-like [Anguilla rostrata]|uniref:B2 bradykinin receptor-like n=1 Tax=Anguilla rostrata TaxID=7938 RepID=UPI0030D05BDC
MVSNSSEGTAPATGSWATDGNECNHTEAWEWVYSMQPAYMGVICVLGMAANAFVLCVFCLQRERRTVADVYLGNLALADLVMVSCLPFWVVTITQEFHWLFGEALCKLVGLTIAMNYYCSILFVTMISVDRYLALVRPMSSVRLRDVSWARVLCLAVWVVAGLLSLPALLFRTVKPFPEYGVEACYLDYPHEGWRIRYNMTVNILGFLIPLTVLSYCSYCIITALKNNQMRKYSAVRTGRKARHLVLIVLVVFILCWLPYQVVMFLDTLYYYHVLRGCLWASGIDISIQLATYLGYGNSSLNAFLYAIVGKHFRQKATRIFKLILNRKDKSETLKTIKFTSITRYNESINLGDSELYLRNTLESSN